MPFFFKYKLVNIWNLCRNIFKWTFVGRRTLNGNFFNFFFFKCIPSQRKQLIELAEGRVCKQSLNCLIKIP